jgi:dihydroorotate dehydrogenase electron transfer subunit
LLKKEKKAEGIFLLTLESGGISFKPGQFVNVLCAQNADFILRRPYSVFNARRDTFQLLFEVKGKGTRALARKEEGMLVDIIAPLGKGFSLNKKALLVAGGMGIAPLNYLAQSLSDAVVFAGARTKDLLLTFGLSREMKVYEVTDDGSTDFKGKVTNLLLEKFDKVNPNFVYACGPEPMLKTVIRFAEEKEIQAEVSLERYMACGTGVCLSCICRTSEGLKRVCTEGPVFGVNELEIGG